MSLPNPAPTNPRDTKLASRCPATNGLQSPEPERESEVSTMAGDRSNESDLASPSDCYKSEAPATGRSCFNVLKFANIPEQTGLSTSNKKKQIATMGECVGAEIKNNPNAWNTGDEDDDEDSDDSDNDGVDPGDGVNQLEVERMTAQEAPLPPLPDYETSTPELRYPFTLTDALANGKNTLQGLRSAANRGLFLPFIDPNRAKADKTSQYMDSRILIMIERYLAHEDGFLGCLMQKSDIPWVAKKVLDDFTELESGGCSFGSFVNVSGFDTEPYSLRTKAHTEKRTAFCDSTDYETDPDDKEDGSIMRVYQRVDRDLFPYISDNPLPRKVQTFSKLAEAIEWKGFVWEFHLTSNSDIAYKRYNRLMQLAVHDGPLPKESLRRVPESYAVWRGGFKHSKYGKEWTRHAALIALYHDWQISEHRGVIDGTADERDPAIVLLRRTEKVINTYYDQKDQRDQEVTGKKEKKLSEAADFGFIRQLKATLRDVAIAYRMGKYMGKEDQLLQPDRAQVIAVPYVNSKGNCNPRISSCLALLGWSNLAEIPRPRRLGVDKATNTAGNDAAQTDKEIETFKKDLSKLSGKMASLQDEFTRLGDQVAQVQSSASLQAQEQKGTFEKLESRIEEFEKDLKRLGKQVETMDSQELKLSEETTKQILDLVVESVRPMIIEEVKKGREMKLLTPADTIQACDLQQQHVGTNAVLERGLLSDQSPVPSSLRPLLGNQTIFPRPSADLKRKPSSKTIPKLSKRKRTTPRAQESTAGVKKEGDEDDAFLARMGFTFSA